MNTTTLRLVAADLAAQIRQITPDYELYGDHVWSPVTKVDEVAGSVLRLFHCEYDPPVVVETGIYGTAIEYESALRVWTNYRGVHDTEGGTQDIAAEIISADARQLWLTLEARQDPVLNGLISVLAVGWTFEDDEPGNIWGSHDFTVTFLLDHT